MEEAVLPAAVLPFGEVQRCFVVLGRPEGSLALGRFVNVLHFTVKEIDPSTGAASAGGLAGCGGRALLSQIPCAGLGARGVGCISGRGLLGWPTLGARSPDKGVSVGAGCGVGPVPFHGWECTVEGRALPGCTVTRGGTSSCAGQRVGAARLSPGSLAAGCRGGGGGRV